MSKSHFIILRNEDPYDHELWVKACKEHAQYIDYHIVDLTASDWLEKIRSLPCDMLLTKPGGKTRAYKQLYDERLQILVNELGYSCFPSLREVLIYENKSYLAYWLKANDIPHPKTAIFYNRKEAESFIAQASFPIVAKLNIGASGHGIEILKSKQDAKKYIQQVFTKGKSPRTGPKLKKGKLFRRAWNKLSNPKTLVNKLKTYKEISADTQKHFVIFQEFIPHDYEWRVVRIGDSFFAHKKLKTGSKASGSLIKGYENPPLKLLDFIKKITDRQGFYSQAIDIFEDKHKGYLVNEMQCIFGQSDPYQMLVDDQPGRYIYENNRWKFEPGDFNQNESYNLRVHFAIKQIAEKLSQ
jgi:glutathione synthase/RimK-type ligase-like ATP-grasp enzyme